MEPGFGLLLKEWRAARRMSQLELGLEANVSARHIAFLETGRARPSREMVLRLAETLDVPLSARNILLGRAGFAPAYGTQGLDAPEAARLRAAVERLLSAHDPYPAFAIDRHWVVQRLNRSATLLLGTFGIGPGSSALDAFLGPLRPVVANWEEIARHLAHRLRAESARHGRDPVLDAAVRQLLAELGPVEPLPAGARAVVPTRLRVPGGELAFFTMITEFGTVEDERIADLRIELFFPADAATEAALTAYSSPGTP